MKLENESDLINHKDINEIGKVLNDVEFEIAPEVSDDTRIIIPVNSVYEFQYLSKNQPARVMCMGHMIAEGFLVTEMRYMM